MEDLEARIPELSDAQVITGLMRLVAMAGDMHTSIFPLPFRQLPIANECAQAQMIRVSSSANR